MTGRTLALVMAAIGSAACGGAAPPEDGAGSPAAGTVARHGTVVILGLDGADWEIIDRLGSQGRLPNLTRLRSDGAAGVLRSERPLLSPIVWTTMATARPPLDHGILGFLTVRQGRTEPVRSDERLVPAFWNVLGDYGFSVGVIGWYASWPAEPVNGFLVSDRVAYHQVEGSAGTTHRGLTHPASLQEEIEPVWRQIEQRLGTDAAARFFSPGGDVEDDAERDRVRIQVEEKRLDTFVRVLRTTELYRALTPRLMERFHPDLTAVYLEGTDAVGHLFAEYAPPALPGTDPDAARRLADVFDRFYEYTDTIVGEIAGRLDPDETTLVVVSDHGFKTGQARPRTPSFGAHRDQAPLWHRPEGILLLWGLGVRPGVELPPATLYDVLPTVYRILGVPLARTLPGRPLEKALTEEILSRPLLVVEDYETHERKPAAVELPPDEVLAKLQALGYVGSEPPAGKRHERAAESGQSAIPSNRYNRGLVLLRDGRQAEALEVFRELQRAEPQRALGFLGEGIVAVRERRYADAIPVLEKALARDDSLPAVHSALGEAYRGAGRVEDSRNAFRKALSMDAADGRTALLLAQLELQRKSFGRAAPLFETARAYSESPVDRAEACVGLAILAEENGDLELAARRYVEALEHEAEFPRALERYGNLELYRGRFDHGVELLARLLQASDEGDARVLTLYGRALLLAGRHSEARETLQAAIRRDPDAAEARELLRTLAEEPH